MNQQNAEQAVQEVQKTVTALERKSKSLEVKTDEDLMTAIDFLANLQGASKEVKFRKEQITKPLNEALKNVRELFAPVEQSIENSTVYVKSLVSKYQQAVEAAARKKEAAIAQKVDQGKLSFESGAKKMEAVKHVETTVKSDVGAVTFRTNRIVEIVDATKLPRKYLVPNEVAIRRAALAGEVIEGVIVREEKIPVITR